MLRRRSERGAGNEERVGGCGRKGEDDFTLRRGRGGRRRVGEWVREESGGRGSGERKDETICETWTRLKLRFERSLNTENDSPGENPNRLLI